MRNGLFQEMDKGTEEALLFLDEMDIDIAHSAELIQRYLDKLEAAAGPVVWGALERDVDIDFDLSYLTDRVHEFRKVLMSR
jgi:hypothetical protein